MIRLAELHPIIVHFPIALLLTSVVLDGLAIWLRRWHLVYTATWLLGFGVVAALLAGVTGTISARTANTSGVKSIYELHQTLGFATGFVFASLFILRILWLSPRLLDALQPRYPALAGMGRQLRVTLPGLWSNRISPLLVGVYMVGSVVGIVLLSLTGYLGGAMVYDHGVGTPSSIIMHLLVR